MEFTHSQTNNTLLMFFTWSAKNTNINQFSRQKQRGFGAFLNFPPKLTRTRAQPSVHAQSLPHIDFTWVNRPNMLTASHWHLFFQGNNPIRD